MIMAPATFTENLGHLWISSQLMELLECGDLIRKEHYFLNLNLSRSFYDNLRISRNFVQEGSTLVFLWDNL